VFDDHRVEEGGNGVEDADVEAVADEEQDVAPVAQQSLDRPGVAAEV